MRRFMSGLSGEASPGMTPANECPWDVVIGRESWGTFVLLFSPVRGDVRKSVLAAETMLAAETELGAMSDGDLRERLASSSPW